jgi:uncharacterized protein
MRKPTVSLFGALFFSLIVSPVAGGERGYLPALDEIYWHQGHMISFMPIAEEPEPMIAVVIDDMGVNRRLSERAVKNLAAPVTLAYLAYARNVQQQVDAAKADGHEVILHLPWESDHADADPGPNHLSVAMTKERLNKKLEANLDAFTGYTGVNNHMGSRFSRHRPGLEVVMEELARRGVFFLDSVTTQDSLAGKVSEEHGIPTLYRNVFMDHVERPAALSAALREAENIARHHGSAIVIGHPKDLTLAALEAWLPAAEAKGFRLVSLSELLRHRREKADIAAAAVRTQ